jgi:hypothetical protein
VSLFVTFIVSITLAASLNSYNSEIRIQNQQLNVTGYTCDIFVDNDMGVGFYILIFFMSILALFITWSLTGNRFLVSSKDDLKAVVNKSSTASHDMK